MNLAINENRIYVCLGTELNTFKFNQMSTNEKFEELHKPNGFVYYQVQNLEEASSLCRNFIKTFMLSSSNWIGGRIINEKGDFLAQISYNGRIWDNEVWDKAKEIV